MQTWMHFSERHQEKKSLKRPAGIPADLTLNGKNIMWRVAPIVRTNFWSFFHKDKNKGNNQNDGLLPSIGSHIMNPYQHFNFLDRYLK